MHTKLDIYVFITMDMFEFSIYSQVLHIIAQSTLCYALLMYTPKHKSHILVFIVGMGYACIAHIYRQYYDYGGYTLDVTRYVL